MPNQLPQRLALPKVDAEHLRREYEPQFTAAGKLLEAVWRSAPTAPRNTFDLVLMNFLGRSIGTFRACLRLLEGGFTDQAWMLNRSLFEDMVSAFWLALPDHRDEAVSLAEAHEREASERMDELLDAVGADDGTGVVRLS